MLMCIGLHWKWLIFSHSQLLETVVGQILVFRIQLGDFTTELLMVAQLNSSTPGGGSWGGGV